MSASRDKSQKCAFIYSNLYKIYKDEKELKQAIPAAPVIKGAVVGVIQGMRPGLKIHTYKPMELTPETLKDNKEEGTPRSASVTLEGLKTSLNELESLHHKLHFMLDDLEQYLKKK